MFDALRNSLIGWNKRSSERQKLQHIYIIIIVVGVVVAGIVSLIDAVLGHNLLYIPMFSLIAFLANAVVWNLLQSVLITKLPKTQRRR